MITNYQFLQFAISKLAVRNLIYLPKKKIKKKKKDYIGIVGKIRLQLRLKLLSISLHVPCLDRAQYHSLNTTVPRVQGLTDFGKASSMLLKNVLVVLMRPWVIIADLSVTLC
jgi:hypothetical protein